jgi:hypothetical protein
VLLSKGTQFVTNWPQVLNGSVTSVAHEWHRAASPPSLTQGAASVGPPSDPPLLDAPLEPLPLLDAPLEPLPLLDAPLEPLPLLDAPLEPLPLLDALPSSPGG